jgi:hypothetical protein
MFRLESKNNYKIEFMKPTKFGATGHKNNL